MRERSVSEKCRLVETASPCVPLIIETRMERHWALSLGIDCILSVSTTGAEREKSVSEGHLKDQTISNAECHGPWV